MKNIFNPAIYNAMIILLKDELKKKPIARGLLLRVKPAADQSTGSMCLEPYLKFISGLVNAPSFRYLCGTEEPVFT